MLIYYKLIIVMHYELINYIGNKLLHMVFRGRKFSALILHNLYYL